MLTEIVILYVYRFLLIFSNYLLNREKERLQDSLSFILYEYGFV